MTELLYTLFADTEKFKCEAFDLFPVVVFYKIPGIKALC